MHIPRWFRIGVFSTLVIGGSCIAVSVLWALITISQPPSTSAEVSVAVQVADSLPRSTGFWFLSQLGFNPPMRTAKRTVAVMVENHENARPHHKGLENATLIEEFLVEGGISRFAAIFDVSNLPSVVGPVRSLRPYFVDGVRPWASAILYAGGSPEAFARVENVPGMKHANGLALPKDFLRDEEIAAPHNLFIPGDRAEELLGTLEINPVLWPPFPAGGAPLTGSAATTIHLNFLSPVHNVTYDYSPWQG